MSDGEVEPFGIHRMRRGLMHFVWGRAASAVLTVVLLILVVRNLPTSEYGIYVALLAVLEISILVGNAPANAVAQRYVSEARLPQNLAFLSRLVWGCLFGSTLALGGIALVLGGFASVVAREIGIAVPAELFRIFLLSVVGEGLCRCTGMIFDSLMEQKLNRVSIVLRSGGKLGGVIGVVAACGALSINSVIMIDAVVTVAVAIGSMAMLATLLARMPAPAGSAPMGLFTVGRIGPLALQMVLSQAVRQLYGPNAIRLLVSRLLGATQAAMFGFAHSLTYLMQQYLPSQLLVGLIRPVLVARRAGGADEAAIGELSGMVLKVNYFIIVPAIAFLGVCGTQLSTWLSGGKYTGAGNLLFALSGLLLVQSVSFVLSLLTVALERRSAILWGTVSAVPGVVIGVSLARSFETGGLVAGLWISELLWCSATWLVLHWTGFTFRFDMVGLGKIAACGVLGAVAGLAAAAGVGGAPAVQLVVCALAVGVTYLVVAVGIKPFATAERARINRLLPRPWWVF